MLKDKTPK